MFLQVLADGICRAGLRMNLQSDPMKAILIGTEQWDGIIQFLVDTVY